MSANSDFETLNNVDAQRRWNVEFCCQTTYWQHFTIKKKAPGLQTEYEQATVSTYSCKCFLVEIPKKKQHPYSLPILPGHSLLSLSNSDGAALRELSLQKLQIGLDLLLHISLTDLPASNDPQYLPDFRPCLRNSRPSPGHMGVSSDKHKIRSPNTPGPVFVKQQHALDRHALFRGHGNECLGLRPDGVRVLLRTRAGEGDERPLRAQRVQRARLPVPQEDMRHPRPRERRGRVRLVVPRRLEAVGGGAVDDGGPVARVELDAVVEHLGADGLEVRPDGGAHAAADVVAGAQTRAVVDKGLPEGRGHLEVREAALQPPQHDGALLAVVRRQEVRPAVAPGQGGQAPRDVQGVLDAAVHAVAAVRRVAVACVAAEDDAPACRDVLLRDGEVDAPRAGDLDLVDLESIWLPDSAEDSIHPLAGVNLCDVFVLIQAHVRGEDVAFFLVDQISVRR